MDQTEAGAAELPETVIAKSAEPPPTAAAGAPKVVAEAGASKCGNGFVDAELRLSADITGMSQG